MNAKEIVERHKQFPRATEKLIEAYAFQEYRKAISDLNRFSDVVEVKNSDTVVIVMTRADYEEWKSLKASHWYLNNCIDIKD